jgi:hypothetical protein
MHHAQFKFVRFQHHKTPVGFDSDFITLL